MWWLLISEEKSIWYLLYLLYLVRFWKSNVFANRSICKYFWSHTLQIIQSTEINGCIIESFAEVGRHSSVNQVPLSTALVSQIRKRSIVKNRFKTKVEWNRHLMGITQWSTRLIQLCVERSSTLKMDWSLLQRMVVLVIVRPTCYCSMPVRSYKRQVKCSEKRGISAEQRGIAHPCAELLWRLVWGRSYHSSGTLAAVIK